MVSILIITIIIILNTGAYGWTHECKEGEFRCNSSRICVPQERICNKIEDCPDKSDEKFCDDEDDDRSWNHLFRKHPAADLDEHSSGCELVNWTSSLCHCVGRAILCHNMGLVSPPSGLPQRGIQLLDLTGNFFPILSAQTMSLPSLQTLVLDHSGVQSVHRGTFTNISGLRALHLSNNQLKTLPESLFQPNNSLQILILRYNELSDLPKNAFLNLHQLQELDLRHNLLQDVKEDVLKPLAHLRILYLSENRLESIPRFGMLPALHELSLAHNRIAWIEPGCLSELSNLQHLYLSWNRLWLLKNKTFANLLKLRRLSLNENRISVLEKGAFLELPQLTSLDLQRNLLKRLDSEVLRHLNNLEYIYFDEFKLCSAALHVRVCEPKGDGISSLQHLLDSIVLRASVWVMAVLACAGNAIVLLGRLVAREPNPVHSLYIKTLALADLLMGVYLLLIAAADWRYRDIYVQHEFQWRHSYVCSICGFLSTLSCEASVLILTLITRDRLVSVTKPLDRRQPSLRRATLHVLALWLVAAVVALLPLSSETVDYFGEEFYGGNGVCLPLHVQDPFAQGWEYSAAMFIVLNAVALVFISCAYWRMLRVVRSSGLSLRSTQERQDRAVAHRFVIIVATDCLCWIPVIGVKLAALAGARVDQQLCAWLAVLVLPVNSALNPILYTLTTSLFKNQMSRFLHAWKSRDAGPSHDSAASLSNMQLNIGKRHPTSQQPTRSSTLRSHGSWKSVHDGVLQGTAV